MFKNQTLVNRLGLTSLSLIAAANVSLSAKAEDSEVDPVCPNNPTNLIETGGFCTLTPEKYGVRIYELGLCTSNPLANNQFNKRSCFTTLSNNTPAETDMAKGQVFNLTSQNPIKGRPEAGKYSHAYIIIDPKFNLQFTYKLNNITYYSNGVNSSAASPQKNAKTTPPARPFIETLNNFGDDEGGFSPKATAIVSGGSITALLTDSNLKASTSATATQRLIGVFVPTKPIEISKSIKGLEVQFIVTDQGGGLETCADWERYFDQVDESERNGERFQGGLPDGSGEVCFFGSGPFSAKFRPF